MIGRTIVICHIHNLPQIDARSHSPSYPTPLQSTSVGVFPEPAPRPAGCTTSIQRAPSSMAATLLATARDKLLWPWKTDANFQHVARSAATRCRTPSGNKSPGGIGRPARHQRQNSPLSFLVRRSFPAITSGTTSTCRLHPYPSFLPTPICCSAISASVTWVAICATLAPKPEAILEIILGTDARQQGE